MTSEVLPMLWLAMTIFLLLWLLGITTSAVEGIVLHMLLVAALGVTLVGIVQGRKAI
ncbi:MAG: DUF5670 family protein [Acidobacteriota bacterium]